MFFCWSSIFLGSKNEWFLLTSPATSEKAGANDMGRGDLGMKICAINWWAQSFDYTNLVPAFVQYVLIFTSSNSCPSTCVFPCFVHLCRFFLDLYKQLDSPRISKLMASLINHHQPSTITAAVEFPSPGLCLDLQHYWSLSTSKSFRATKMWMYRSQGPSNWGFHRGDLLGLEDFSIFWGVGSWEFREICHAWTCHL